MASCPLLHRLQGRLQREPQPPQGNGQQGGPAGSQGREGEYCASFSSNQGLPGELRFLVEESGIDVNSVTETGGTPMLYAAQEGNVQIIRYLLDCGGDPAMPDERGSTPLHDVAMQGHPEAVRLLLSKGAPVDPVDHRGAPLHLAASNDHVEVVKVLLEHAADLNKVVLHIASPLVMAFSGQALKCIKLLIEAGADVNGPGYPAPTPLEIAVHEGLTDIVKLLLEAGADPNIPDEHGAIPIELAAAHRRREIVEVLFPRTKPIPSLPDWSVDGIIRTMNSPRSNPPQDTASMEERITDFKSQGKEAFAKEDYLTALSFYWMAVEINPLDASIFANMSLCWLRMRHGDNALKEARKCRMMQPRWSKAWYREGAALSFLKNYDDAADAFREALQLDPKSEEIREALRKAEKAAEESRRV